MQKQHVSFAKIIGDQKVSNDKYKKSAPTEGVFYLVLTSYFLHLIFFQGSRTIRNQFQFFGKDEEPSDLSKMNTIHCVHGAGRMCSEVMGEARLPDKSG